MHPECRTADQILANELFDNYSWHFFQAISWLDFAKRTQRPAALHYAAFELRYGIEYLLFELLVLSNHDVNGLTEPEYQECLGDPKAMKKALRSSRVEYEKRADFTRILLSLEPNAPKLRYWKLDELFRYWGIASEFLHFVGAHSKTYVDSVWFVKSVARLETILGPIREDLTKTDGFGLMSMNSMGPEVLQAWQEFSAGKLKEEDLRLRMRIIQPALRARKHKSAPLIRS